MCVLVLLHLASQVASIETSYLSKVFLKHKFQVLCQVKKNKEAQGGKYYELKSLMKGFSAASSIRLTLSPLFVSL